MAFSGPNTTGNGLGERGAQLSVYLQPGSQCGWHDSKQLRQSHFSILPTERGILVLPILRQCCLELQHKT